MKHRQYSIVFHNVLQEKSQEVVKQYVAKSKEYVMSCEPYPEDDGFHMHLFIQYPNQRSFFSVLRELETLKKKFVAPKPDGQDGDWGRVQLDPMRGRFDQCNDYLQGLTKDKPTGEVMTGVQKKCCTRHRYTKRIGDKKNMERFCGKCGSAKCLGCCPGCIVCDEGISKAYDYFMMKNMMDVINKKIPDSEFGKIPSPAELQEIKKNLRL
jgi:hypothetical protein